MEQIAINILPKGAKPVCHSSQFDEGRQIMFNLFNDDTPYTLSGTETISVLVHKPDGTEVIDSVTNTSDNYVIWDVSADACELSGVCECELSIVENGILLGSKNFIMKVEEDAYGGRNIEVRTASGKIATFSTNMVEAFKSLKSDINPVQDLHGYSKPWVGGGGKNKANKANDLPSGSGITITVANDGTLTINGTSTEACYIRGYFNCPDSTATYTWALFNNKAFESGVEFSIRTTDNSSAGGWARVNATNKTLSFTPSATPTKWQFQISSGITFNNAVFKPMIVSGNTAPTDYEPYENICPISGFSALNVTRTGVNLWDEMWEHKKGYSSGAMLSSDTNISSKNYISVVSGITIYVKIPSTLQIYLYQYDNTQTFLSVTRINSSSELTLGATTKYIKFASLNNGYSGDYQGDISINYPSSDTEYHAYNGQTATVNFGQTVYGGVADVTNGKVLIDRLYKTYNGSENWQISGAQSGKYRVALSEVIDNVLYPTSTSEVLDCICNMFEKQNSDSTYRLVNGISYQTNSGLRIYSSAYDTNDITLWKSFLANNPLQVVYKLATPIEITTTPENLTAIVGQNNVYGDTNGDTEVEYYIEV